MNRRKLFLFFCLILLIGISALVKSQVIDWEKIPVAEARQGVAVDSLYFYVINNYTITKHEKASGKQLKAWNGKEFGMKHLNSGIVIGNRLYCAHSNYPGYPMVSSVEVFDANSLEPVSTHSFGIAYGSLTWYDYKDGYWWAVFANYNKEGYLLPNTFTQLIQFTERWEPVQAWVFPESLIEKFGKMSSSGGVLGADSSFYITGHDNPEIYKICIPRMGSVLIHEKTYTVPIKGQAIALDRSQKPFVFYGIDREAKQVIRFVLDEEGGQ